MRTVASSEDEGEPWPEVLPSILDLFAENLGKYSNVVALVSTHQPPQLFDIGSILLDNTAYTAKPYLRWTFKHVGQGLNRLVQGLLSQGVQPDTPIFTFVANSAEYMLLMWAAFYLRCPFVPINPRNLQNSEEVTHMIKAAWSITQSRKGVFIAENDNTADQIDKLGIQNEYQIFIRMGENTKRHSRRSFTDLMQHQFDGAVQLRKPFGDSQAGKQGILLFTSGTTSLPKGCFNTLDMFNRIAYLRQSATKFVIGDSFCTSLPNNHALNINFVLTAYSVGASVVFPGTTFAARHALDVLHLEKCTHTTAVPTMISAMATEIESRGGKLKSLKTSFVSGAAVTPEALATCQDILGSQNVECGFGMTEGAFIFAGSKDRSELVRENGVTVGKAITGSSVKICLPDQQDSVPRGTPGELHYCGKTLIDGYVGLESADFYRGEDSRTWFKTGDQAVMDEDGFIFIVGRYKENIIRGGENIAPAAIEAVICRVPSLRALNVQIIGAPDKIAGEVPVAVVPVSLNEKIVEELKETVLHEMGPQYVPNEVIGLDMLGLDDLPKTMAGKIQKMKLKTLASDYLKKTDPDLTEDQIGDDELKPALKQIWRRAIGHDVDENAPIADFADSITLMSVRDRISKRTGKDVSLSDMIEARTIAGQAELLIQAQKRSKPRLKGRIIRNLQEPINSSDVLPFIAQPDLFTKVKIAIDNKLDHFGLSWKDMEAVTPVYDYARILSQADIYDYWVVTSAILPTKGTKVELSKSIETTLKNNPMLTSFMFWDEKAFGSDLAFYVVPKWSQKLSNMCISDGGKIGTEDELRQKCMTHDERTNAKLPGPMLHATLFEIEETGQLAALIVLSHTVVDGSYGPLIFEDLDRALGGMDLVSHVDYKFWADSYFALRTSFEAQLAVNWHTQRLQEMVTHRQALYPSQNYQQPSTYTGLSSKHGQSFAAPGVLALRRKHGDITAPVILKTAFALINTYRTGHTHALFANMEAARTRFPFVPRALEQLQEQNFEASDVAGATIQEVINLIEIKPQETVLEFLYRMQDDQNNLTKHASAPLQEIMSNLGDEGGKMILDVIRTSVFNWIPGMGATGSNPYSNMEVVSAGGRLSSVRLVLNAGFGGQDSSTMFMRFKGYAFDAAELKQLGSELESVTKWLTDAENWNSPVVSFTNALKVQLE